MITKERLEELIEQGAKIFYFDAYEDNDWGIVEVDTKNFTFSHNENCYTNFCKETYRTNPQPYKMFEDALFETKEEAEWHKEFGYIFRIETLELPTYEWMQPKEDEQDVYYSFYNYKHELMGIRVTKQKIALYKSYRCSDLTSTVDIFDNTKENYTLACRKAKELFLGENK